MKHKPSRKPKCATRRSVQPDGSAAASNNTNLWRRYRLTHVTVAWQERYGGHWHDYSKQITHEDFAKHYSQVPPNGLHERPGATTKKDTNAK